MGAGGGDVAAIDPSILGGAGQSIGGGWMAAPDMQSAGYGLPDPSQGPDSWWQRNLGNVSNKDLAGALKNLGSSTSGGAAAAGKGAGPPMPGTGGGGAGVGRGGGVSLGPLLQLLNQRRDMLLQSATGGVGMGQPQGARPTAGLLGF